MDLITTVIPLPSRRDPPSAAELSTITEALRAIPTVEHVRLRVDGPRLAVGVFVDSSPETLDAASAAVRRELAGMDLLTQPD